MQSVAHPRPVEEVRPSMPHPEEYFSAVRDTNPFAANRVNEPSPHDVDVPGIHAEAYDLLTGFAKEVWREQSAVGAALLGGAGVGKSHLLSRLFRWAEEKSESGEPRACFVYLHGLLTSPDALPRYMLKYVVSRLAEGGQGQLELTPLYRFVERAIRKAIKASGANPRNAREVHDAYHSSFAGSPGGSRLIEVLYQFLRLARPKDPDASNRRRSIALEALSWLSGDAIDPDDARELGLRTDGQKPVELQDDQEIFDVLLGLTQFARVNNQPFVLCIDQVDNIEAEKLKALARFLHELIDRAKNLLVITSGVGETLLAYKKDQTIPPAAWARIGQYPVPLKSVLIEDGRKILEARLEQFHEPFLGLEIVRRHLQQDTLFPLSRAWLDNRLGKLIELPPRDLLIVARDAWRQEQQVLACSGGEAWVKGWPRIGKPPDVMRLANQEDIEKAIDETVDRVIKERLALHRLHPGSLPPDAGNLAALVECLLKYCQGENLPYTFQTVERVKGVSGRLPTYDLLVSERGERDGRNVKTGLVFVTNMGLSATAALRRMVEDQKPPEHRLLVTDHERRPLHVGAQGREYSRRLEKLGRDRFHHLRIDFEQYARLDALHEVIGMARTGNLVIEAPPGIPRHVTEAEAIASHHRKDRFRQHVLLRPLLTEDPEEKPPPARPKPPLDEKDLEQYIMAQLAWMMGSTTQAIAKGYVEVMKGTKVTYEVAWPQVKMVAGKLHARGLVHATPQDDDLFLLLRKSTH